MVPFFMGSHDNETPDPLKEIEQLKKDFRDLVLQSNPQLRGPLDALSQRTIESLILYPIQISIPGTQAATATNYSVFFTADRPYYVEAVVESHTTAGTDGSAVTLQVERLQGTEALDAGDPILATAFSLKATANTTQYGTLLKTAVTILNRGDRLALKDAGTLTAVAGLNVVVYLRTL